MLTVVAVLRKACVCSWALRLITRGCTAVDWGVLGLDPEPGRASLASTARGQVHALVSEDDGRGLDGGAKVYPRHCLGAWGRAPALDVPGTEEIRHKEMFSAGRSAPAIHCPGPISPALGARGKPGSPGGSGLRPTWRCCLAVAVGGGLCVNR